MIINWSFPPPMSAHLVPPCSCWCTRQGVPFSPRATGSPTVPEHEASRWLALLAAGRPPGGQGLSDRTGSWWRAADHPVPRDQTAGCGRAAR